MQWRELFLKQIHKETFHEERKKVHCYKINLLLKKSGLISFLLHLL